MDVVRAREILGLRGDESLPEIRSRYRELVRARHPDTNSDPGAAESTMLIVQSYRYLVGFPPGSLQVATDDGSREASAGRTDSPTDTSEFATLVDDETVMVRSSSAEAFAELLAVGHELGDVTYLDRQNHLLEILLRTVHGDVLSLVATLQGRANEGTEIFLTLEPLDVAVREIPSINGVALLIAHHLNYRHHFG